MSTIAQVYTHMRMPTATGTTSSGSVGGCSWEGERDGRQTNRLQSNRRFLRCGGPCRLRRRFGDRDHRTHGDTVAAADSTTPLSSDTTIVITEQCQELAEAIGDNPVDEGGDFGQVADQLEEAAAIAPAEVADDLGVLAQTYRDAADRLEAAGIDMENPETFAGEDTLAEMEEVLALLSSPEFQVATEALLDFCTEE